MRKERLKNEKTSLSFSNCSHALPTPHDCLHSIKKIKVSWETPPIEKFAPHKNLSIDLQSIEN